MIHCVTKSSDETQSLAGTLADAVQQRDLVLLVGQMGSGKTTFTQGFGKALGVSEPITSPTFVLMRTYEARIKVHHVDIYRLDHLQEVIDLGLMELLDEGGVALMEWGDLATPVLPHDFLEVRLDFDSDDEAIRHVYLRGVGQTWPSREKLLVDQLDRWRVSDPGVEE